MALIVERWRERIVEVWAVHGTGTALDPAVVDRLAEEFAKPFPWPAFSVEDLAEERRKTGPWFLGKYGDLM